METEPELIEQYVRTRRATLIYRHLLQLGDVTRFLSEASECAGEQERFWEMRELIYRRQNELFAARSYESIAPLVQELALDETAFRGCLESGRFRQQVEDDYAAARREGVASRPVMDINGTRVVGAQPFSAFQRVLDAAE